jgi:predicted PurR-regulated permease PerM
MLGIVTIFTIMIGIICLGFFSDLAAVILWALFLITMSSLVYDYIKNSDSKGNLK